MYYFFVFFVLLSLLAFLFKKRNFDFLSIYYIMLFLYNMTTMLGVVNNKYSLNFEQPNEYLYLVSAFPFIFATLFLLIDQPKNMTFVHMRYSYNRNRKSRGELQLFLNLLIAIMIVYTITNFNSLFLSKSKVELLENRSSASMFVAGFFPMMFMLAYVLRKKKTLYLLSVFLFIMFLFGSRSSLASVVLTVLILLLYGSKIRVIQKRWMMFFGVLGLNSVILGKTLYGHVLARGISDGFASWIQEFDFMNYYRIGSEFLGTSTILNKVIETNFSTTSLDILFSFLSLQPIPVSYFGLDSGIFNKRFQPVLFPGIDYGMAYNIWAEVFSWSGIFGVALFSFLIPLALYYLWNLYVKNIGSFWSLLLIIVGFTLSFWIHRNSIGTISANIRNVFYPLVFLWFIAKFMFGVKQSILKGQYNG